MIARSPLSRQLCLLFLTGMLATAAPTVTNPAPAYGGAFQVLACDAAGGPHGSWNGQPGSVEVFKICPSSNLPAFGGMVTRLAGRTFANGQYSRLWFYAPPGTTIAGMTWSGGFNDYACVWANHIRALGAVDATLLGHGPGWCTGNQNTGLTWLAAPAGTTALLQNTQCGASTCPSTGAALRTRSAAVIINDPTPPGLSITGGGLSGARGWVRGTQDLTVYAGDETGIRLLRTQIEGYPEGIDRGKICDFSATAPCTAGNGETTIGPIRTTELRPGPHTVTVTAFDAAHNPTSRSTTVRVDNDPPPPPAAVVEGGSGWRAVNAYTLRWATPESPSANRAPITAVRYRVCPADSMAGCMPTHTVTESVPTDVSPKVPGEGEYDVSVALVDAAGNGAGDDAQWSQPVRLRFDPDAVQVRAGVVKATFKRKRVKVRGKRRIVRRRVVRLLHAKRVRYGGRFEVIGRLITRSGQPRANTEVDVYGRSNRVGGPESYLGSVRADTGGHFVYRAQARQSHMLRFARRASTATVELRVPGRVTFHARPRSVVNGEAVTLRGRVLGDIPAGGKQVVIQAYSRGKWRTFQLLRTDVSGRYRHIYRFDGTRGKVVYPLRAVVTKESTFPYEPGRSRVRRVTVRGL